MPCHDCKRSAKIVKCEIHNPPSAKICKNCCISEFKGHKCPWWSMCWVEEQV